MWAHLATAGPETVRDLVVVGRTGDWPAPPFALSRRPPAPVRAALRAALADVRPGDVPGLERTVPADIAPYRAMARSADARTQTLRRAGIGGGVSDIAERAARHRRDGHALGALGRGHVRFRLTSCQPEQIKLLGNDSQ